MPEPQILLDGRLSLFIAPVASIDPSFTMSLFLTRLRYLDEFTEISGRQG